MYSEYFIQKRDEEGERYIYFSPDAPKYLKETFDNVERDLDIEMSPKGWAIEALKECFELIENKKTIEDLQVKPYFWDLIEWAQDGSMRKFCDEALVFDDPKNFLDLLTEAQRRAKKEIFKKAKELDDRLENEPCY